MFRQRTSKPSAAREDPGEATETSWGAAGGVVSRGNGTLAAEPTLPSPSVSQTRTAQAQRWAGVWMPSIAATFSPLRAWVSPTGFPEPSSSW